MKAWEDHCASNGKPDSHAKAKEILYVHIFLSVCYDDLVSLTVLDWLVPSSTASSRLKA